MMGDDRLAQRRAAMIAAGYWRDKTILDHLDRAIECTPDKTAIVAIRSRGRTGEASDLQRDRSSLRYPSTAARRARRWPRRRRLVSVAELVGIFRAASRLPEAWCRQ